MGTYAQREPEHSDYVHMVHVLDALRYAVRPFEMLASAVDCHHNYVARERHAGANVWLTRKGSMRARDGDLGIVPGSMRAQASLVDIVHTLKQVVCVKG